MAAAHLRSPVIPSAEYRKGCTGKQAYGTEGQARKAGKKNATTLRQYQCEHCGCWHKTSWARWDRPGERASMMRAVSP